LYEKQRKEHTNRNNAECNVYLAVYMPIMHRKQKTDLLMRHSNSKTKPNYMNVHGKCSKASHVSVTIKQTQHVIG